MVFGYQQLQNQFNSKGGFLCPTRPPTSLMNRLPIVLLISPIFTCLSTILSHSFCKQQAWWRKSMKWANIFFSLFDVFDCPLMCWFLKLYRFYCASAVDNRTRLDFHGERRIWDGRLIKQKIKGNSALYIYTDEVLQLICRYIVVWGTNGIQCLRLNFLFHGKCLPTTVEPLQSGRLGT